MRSLAVLAVAVFVGGCASTTPSPGSSTNIAFAAPLDDVDPDTHLTQLPRGEAAPGHGDAAVRVIAHGLPCSGALVGPNLVLTAQHCVADREEGDVPPGFVWVELGGGALPWGRVRARKVVPCEGWTGGAAFDVAAIVLEAPVPDVVPFALGTATEGDAVHAAGFGTGMVIRSMPQTTWHTFQSTRTERHGTTNVVADEVIAVAMGSHGGDSGSPLLNDRGELVGITSHGREGETALTLAARVDACPTMFRDAR